MENLLIVDQSTKIESINLEQEFLSNFKKIDVSHDINEAINLLYNSIEKNEEYKIIIILSLNLNEEESITVLFNQINNMNFNIKPLVVVNLENFEKIFIKNFKEKEKIDKSVYIKNAIDKIYNKKKLRVNNYIYQAVIICLDDYKKIFDISAVYKEIGKMYGIAPTTVEKSIRNVINKGWEEDKLRAFCIYIDNSIFTEKVTNHTLISSMVLACQKNLF